MKKYGVHLLALTPLAFMVTGRVAGAQSGEYLVSLFEELGSIIEVAVPVFVALALALFLWGLVVFMTKAGEDQEKGKQHMVWGIVILTVAVAVWAIVALIREIFGVENDVSPDAPRIPTAG